MSLTEKQIKVLNEWPDSEPALKKGVLPTDETIQLGDTLKRIEDASVFADIHPMNGINISNRSEVAYYFNDFMNSHDDEVGGGWILTDVVGTAFGFDVGVSGRVATITLTAGTNAGDHSHVQSGVVSGGETGWFEATIGRRLGFATRVFFNDDDFDWIVGLVEESPNLFTSNDGLYFRHNGDAGGNNTIEFVSKLGGVETTLEVFEAPHGEDHFIDLGFQWDGVDTITVYKKLPRGFNGFALENVDRNWIRVGTITGVGSIPITDVSARHLTALSIANRNTPGGASQISVDYLEVAQERA